MLEKEMFIPIKNHFIMQGFEVKAEVLDVDIMALKEDLTVIIEMKINFNLKLLYQGAKRQQINDYVYIAIPKPCSKTIKSKSFKEKVLLVKRLHLGLIFVDIITNSIIIFIEPSYKQDRKNKKLKVKLAQEFANRITSDNYGGLSRTKIITSYRERAILIAYFLRNENKEVKDIKRLTNDIKCSSILQKNYYGWYNRVSRGIYELSPLGKENLIKYDQVLQQIIKTKNII